MEWAGPSPPDVVCTHSESSSWHTVAAVPVATCSNSCKTEYKAYYTNISLYSASSLQCLQAGADGWSSVSILGAALLHDKSRRACMGYCSERPLPYRHIEYVVISFI